MGRTRYFASGILFVLMTVMGFVTKALGRPLNTAAFTVHKLMALAFVVYTVINVIGIIKKKPVHAMVWVLIAITGLLTITLFATGALLSSETPVAPFIHVLHDLSPALLLISVGLTYFVARRQRNTSHAFAYVKRVK